MPDTRPELAVSDRRHSYNGFSLEPIHAGAQEIYATPTFIDQPKERDMRKLISMICVAMLSCASGFALAEGSSSTNSNTSGSSSSDMTTSGSSGSSATDTRSGSVGNDQETRAGQNTRDGSNAGSPTTPPNSSNR
jgi:hypothetical protein